MRARVATARRLLRFVPALTVAAFLLPIAAGLVGTLLPAFGYLPAIGGDAFSLDPWRRLFAYPGLRDVARDDARRPDRRDAAVGRARVRLLRRGARAGAWLRRARRVRSRRSWRRRTAALAIGFAFLHRALGLDRARDFAVADRLDVAARRRDGRPPVADGARSLCLRREGSAVPRADDRRRARIRCRRAQHLAIARSLGYGRVEAWLKVVAAAGLSAGPTADLRGARVFAVGRRRRADPRPDESADARGARRALVHRCRHPALLSRRGRGDAARWRSSSPRSRAWLALERRAIAARPALDRARRAQRRGQRWSRAARSRARSSLFVAARLLAIVGMALWSFAAQWRFPAALPDAWTFANWIAPAGPRSPRRSSRRWCSASPRRRSRCCWCSAASKTRRRRAAPRRRALAVAALHSAAGAADRVPVRRAGAAGADRRRRHARRRRLGAPVFVLPYLFLSLADPWRALDPRYARTAASLGASPRARLPRASSCRCCCGPVLIACAVAFAVSVGQYLPTLFAGNGRVATLTTDAVTLAARRRPARHRRLCAAAGAAAVARLCRRGRASAWRSAHRRGCARDEAPHGAASLPASRSRSRDARLVRTLDLECRAGRVRDRDGSERQRQVDAAGVHRRHDRPGVPRARAALRSTSDDVTARWRRKRAAHRHPVPGRSAVSASFGRRAISRSRCRARMRARDARRAAVAQALRGGRAAGIRDARPGDAVRRPARARRADAHAARATAGAAARRAVQQARRAAAAATFAASSSIMPPSAACRSCS